MLQIHSRKSQSHRNRISERFRTGRGLVMFTSDVSARGMDYPDVSAVIQARKYGFFGGGARADSLFSHLSRTEWYLSDVFCGWYGEELLAIG